MRRSNAEHALPLSTDKQGPAGGESEIEYTTAAIGIGASVVTGALSVWWSRRNRVRGILLRADAGRLRVFTRDPKKPALDIALDDLLDIALETKTVERIVEGGSANLGMAYLNPRIAPPTDTNRIVLETEGDAFPLTAGYHGHADTLEWFAKIRLFLRKAGWAPLEERGTEDDLSSRACKSETNAWCYLVGRLATISWRAVAPASTVM